MLKGDEREKRLCELNVIEQVHNVAGSTIVRGVWKTQTEPIVHGWVYDINGGLLHELCVQSGEDSDLRIIETPA